MPIGGLFVRGRWRGADVVHMSGKVRRGLRFDRYDLLTLFLGSQMVGALGRFIVSDMVC